MPCCMENSAPHYSTLFTLQGTLLQALQHDLPLLHLTIPLGQPV